MYETMTTSELKEERQTLREERETAWQAGDIEGAVRLAEKLEALTREMIRRGH